jgi:hypothetical protein
MQFFLAIVVFPYSTLRRRYQNSLEAIEIYESRANIPFSEKLRHLLTFRVFDRDSWSSKQKVNDTKDTIKIKNKLMNKKKALMKKAGSMYDKRLSVVKKLVAAPVTTLSNMRNKHNLRATSDFPTHLKSTSKNPYSTIFQTSKKKQKQVEKKIMLHILYSNLEFIGLIGRSTATELVSRDIYITKINKISTLLTAKRELILEQRVKEIVSKVFMNFSCAVMYIFYIMLFFFITSRHLEHTETFKSYRAFKGYLTEQKYYSEPYGDDLNFLEVNTLLDFRYWLLTVVFFYK